jgi:hypothetical protein
MPLPVQTPYGVSRTGKPINIGDTVSISGIITAITGYGTGANVTVLCSGALDGPTDVIGGVQQGVYSYSIGVPLAGGTNAPSTGVYAVDMTATQSY